ncbi:MAG: glutamine amidotransferase, partial [Phycisphaerae bacterium]
LALGTEGGAWMALLALEVALAVGVFYSSVYAYLGRRRITGLMILRCAGILALMLILFKPALNVTAGGAGDRPYLPILVDRSGSMGTIDDNNLPDRYRQAVGMLSAQTERIERHFSPLWYHFGSSASAAESLGSMVELKPAGEGTDSTNLAAAIRTAAADYPSASLAGILILTDGVHNTSDVVTDAAVEAGVPVYPVVVGSPSEKLSSRRNIEIVSVAAPLEAVVNNVTTITVQAKVAGFANVPLEVRLMEAGSDKPVGTERLWPDQNVATLTAGLKWTPRALPGEKDGAADVVRKLRVVIPHNPAEAVSEDNETELHVLLTEPRVRVLYVEGSMRPEYKYLKRLLSTDPNLRFMGLVRITGNRFWAQGDIGGQKLAGLPSAESDFELFDVIIIGDLDRTFLTREQMARIRKFVNDGGAMLMLGGHNSFGPGGYAGTDIEAALPVTVGARAQPQETTPFIPQLTAPGEAHPIFEGLKDFFPGPGGRKPSEKLPKLPQLLGCVTVVGAKPAAALLALHPTRKIEGRAMPILAVQRFGAGRSAAFTADTTWKWYLPMRGMGRESPYERFWGQLLRWLANVETKARESRPSVVMRLDRTYQRIGQGPVKVLARVQDEKGRPADNAQVSCTVTPADGKGKAENLSLSPRMGDRLFETEYRPPGEGKYKLEVAALDSAGSRLGSDQQDLIVVPYSKEMDRLARNDALLELVADKTDGRKVEISGLPDLIDQIVQRQKAKGKLDAADQAEVYPLFDFTTLFIIFIALLTGEWLLRRRWNLR